MNAALPLYIWISPGFPVGAFAYSHGLEWAVEAGDIHNAASLALWLRDIADHGAARNDAIFAALAWRAMRERKTRELNDLNALAVALANSRERHLETTTQGKAFLAIIRDAWPVPADMFDAGDVAYPVAFGAAAAAHGCPLAETVEALLLGFFSNLVSAALRLGVIGQTDGQRIIAKLLPRLRALAAAAHNSTHDDLGSCAVRSELAALYHETQYSRLFRS